MIHVAKEAIKFYFLIYLNSKYGFIMGYTCFSQFFYYLKRRFCIHKNSQVCPIKDHDKIVEIALT